MTDQLRAAAEAALEALLLTYSATSNHSDAQWQAISDLRSALAEPEAEPVAWSHNLIDNNIIQHRPADLGRHPDRWTPLYTTPPSREWQSLTDEEIEAIWDGGTLTPYRMQQLREIENKLKEKNT